MFNWGQCWMKKRLWTESGNENFSLLTNHEIPADIGTQLVTNLFQIFHITSYQLNHSFIQSYSYPYNQPVNHPIHLSIQSLNHLRNKASIQSSGSRIAIIIDQLNYHKRHNTKSGKECRKKTHYLPPLRFITQLAILLADFKKHRQKASSLLIASIIVVAHQTANGATKLWKWKNKN